MDVSDEGGIRTIAFDRPDVLNAFTGEVAAELAGEIEACDPDSHHAIVLTGERRAFSAGGDIEAMAERDETPEEAYERTMETFGRLTEAVLSSRVPVVARVNGDAVGAGMALVAVSDFAYAVESARFSAAFVRVGLVPDTGGTFVLPGLVGMRTAKELAFTGRFFDAIEAAEMGLINEAVPDDALDERIDELLETLERRPTRTIGLAKRALHENVGKSWREALDYEVLVQAQAYSTPEHAEGVAAFLEDRDPEF